MFVKTIKLKKAAAVLMYLLLALLIVFAVVFVINRTIKPKGIAIATQEEQTAFLKELGWETSPEPIDCRSVIIPETWNDVYTEYNKLQLQQGFNLEKYKGAVAEIYTYEVYNYGERKPNVIANLVICDGKLIAGDICCTELGGFMQGLAKQAQ